MSITDINLNNNDNIPKILEQRDVIILDETKECNCGRAKRVHCPFCGKTKMYGYADTVLATIPSTGDIVKGCKTYRCSSCAEKFNDVDWYFNCHAPKKIDLAATKRMQEEKIKAYWMDRIARMEKFDYNTRTKCIAQCGLDPWAMQELLVEAKNYKARARAKQPENQQTTVLKLKDEIDNLEAWVKDHPEDLSSQKEIEQLKQELKELENEQ